jgi:hypothetical protein
MKNHLHTSEGMPSARDMITMRVPSDLNKKLWSDEIKNLIAEWQQKA